MKHLLLTTIAAVVLVGCGGPPKDIWEAAEQGDIEAIQPPFSPMYSAKPPFPRTSRHLKATHNTGGRTCGWTI